MVKLRVFSVLFVVFMLCLSACGGGAPAAEESAPVEASSTQATTDGSASDTESSSSEGTAEFFLQIAKIVGTVEVRASASDEYTPAQEGQRLLVGAQIRTGADGIVALYRDAKTMVIVDNNSEVEVKTLDGTADVPVTVILLLSGAAALDHHGEQLPEGALFSIETPEGNNGGVIGSTVRVQYNPETKIMTATCLTGTCEFVRGDQKLTLQAGQAVDVEGLQPPPGAPEEMSVDQANQFLAMGYQLCGGCPITIGDIRDGGLSDTAPAPENLDQPTGENSGGSENSNDSSTDNSNSDSSNDNSSGGGSDSGNDSGGGESGGSDTDG